MILLIIKVLLAIWLTVFSWRANCEEDMPFVTAIGTVLAALTWVWAINTGLAIFSSPL